ncbi:DUF3592 domain-containing protein [[Mycobacterium] crassicus]|uniref:DUF3592 domain-containing protein n=1 Tax=[Mycobacterium] crassicus TaxID=2872309 RepID=A0ABU5XHD5_9MYCO|nr:DUF3592 domain-containing protein [Mycolicibacter sp. MYC098]MEB3021534.1 DUF3592 domain-containing protein [Mycolicibacter sp. MYC098]
MPHYRSLKPLLDRVVHGEGAVPRNSRAGRLLRWARMGVLIVVAVVTLQSVLLVAGAWRNDIAIESDMGVAAAEVLNAGFRRSTIEFVTPERITYRPELGVLYPSELATGMRIYVEYDKSDPDLVRVQHRTAVLAVIPAGSVVVVAWLVGIAALAGLALIERRWGSRGT